jgi:hypothetical protein
MQNAEQLMKLIVCELLSKRNLLTNEGKKKIIIVFLKILAIIVPSAVFVI